MGEKSVKNFIILCLYRIALEYIYVFLLCDIWAYSGFINQPTAGSYVLSWAIFLLFAPIMERASSKKNPSSMMVLVLYYFVFVPGTVMLGRYPSKVGFAILYCIYWALLSFAFFVISEFKLPKPNYKMCCTIINLCAIVFSAVVLYVWACYAHFRIILSMSDVYAIREEALQYSLPRACSYLLAASRSVIPTICIYKLANKKYFSFLILVAVQLINFSIDGLKTALFSLVVAIACYLFFDKGIKKLFLRGLLALNVVGILEWLIFSKHSIITIFVRRVLFVPSLFNYYYYAFFSANPPDYFRQTFLKYFGAVSEYVVRIPYIIGQFKGNPGEYANNGLFSDAFSNLGVVGIFVMPFAVMFFLKLFDSCAAKVDNRLVIGAIVANCITLISSNLSVFVVSQGFLVTCLIILFLPESCRHCRTKEGLTNVSTKK